MCHGNSLLKTQNIGNGTLCRVKHIKLKSDAPPLYWKNWDRVKVYTVSARHVEWIEFERFPEDDKRLSLKSTISQMEAEPNKHSKVELNTMQKKFEDYTTHTVL